jgi:hypothetical protein
VSYPPPPPGYPPPYGAPPPGYGYYPPQRPPSLAPAYLTVVLFLVCGAMSLVFAIVSWDGTTDSGNTLAAVIGIVFSAERTDNIDFGISATMTVACTTLTFALVLLGRFEFVRWILVVLGALITAYYLYAIIWILAHDSASVVGLPVVALLLWAAATVVALLPATGRAMRGAQPQYIPPPPPPPQYYGGPRY